MSMLRPLLALRQFTDGLAQVQNEPPGWRAFDNLASNVDPPAGCASTGASALMKPITTSPLERDDVLSSGLPRSARVYERRQTHYDPQREARAAASSTSFAMVLKFRAVPSSAAGIFSFERPIPAP
jgi:hypothetical protein